MKSEQFLASLLSGQYINTIKQAEQWGFPTPFLSRPVSKAVAEMPVMPLFILDSGFFHVALLSNRRAEQIKNKLSVEGCKRRGDRRSAAQAYTQRPLHSHYSQVLVYK